MASNEGENTIAKYCLLVLGLCIGWIEMIQFVLMILLNDTAGIVDTYLFEQNEVNIQVYGLNQVKL